MGHKSETQTHLFRVPTPYRRKDSPIFYLRQRIPTDLVDAGVYGKRKDFKKSLGTSDWARAKELALSLALQWSEEWRKERHKLRSNEFLHCRNLGSQKRKLGSLSDLERQELLRRIFMDLELTSPNALRDRADMPNEELQAASEGVGTDLTVLEQSSQLTGHPGGWNASLREFLDREGIEVDAPDSVAFREVQDPLDHASVENTWWTYQNLQGKSQSERDRVFIGLGSESKVERLREGSPTLEQLCDSYSDYKSSSGLSQSSLDKYPSQFRVMFDCFGKNREVDSISIEDAKGLTDFLAQVPTNATKRYPGLPLAKAAKREARKRNPDFIAAKTQRDLFIGISSIFRYAAEMEWIDSNPLAKRLVSSRLPKAEKQDKPMLSADEMNQIFSSPKFLAERDSLRERARGEARFWVPFLCLFHGFRTNEVCQLLVADVKREEGIDFLHLRETDDEGEKVKQFKTKASRRKVPLHDELIRIGFLGFVESRREAGEICLFPSLEANRRGSKAGSVGKWFGRLRKELLTDLPKMQGAKGLHSLRHSFARACRDQGIQQEIIWALGGWTGERRRNAEADYGSGYGLKTLKEAIDKIEYPGVDFASLYPKVEGQ